MAELAESRGPGGLRDALLVRIMSDCLLRGAEAAALDVADVRDADGWLRVEVRRSKTDQEGRGVVLYAGAETARLARRWLEAAGAASGPLFRPVNKAGRAAEKRLSVRTVVKRCAGDAGIGGRVSGHSLRVGSAQSLRDAGATMAELMAAGRWTRAETVARYTREQDAAAGVVARLRYGAAPSGGRRGRSGAGRRRRRRWREPRPRSGSSSACARRRSARRRRRERRRKGLRRPKRPW